MKFIVKDVNRSHRTSQWDGGTVQSNSVTVYLESEDSKCSMELSGPSFRLSVGDEIVIGHPSYDRHVIEDLEVPFGG